MTNELALLVFLLLNLASFILEYNFEESAPPFPSACQPRYVSRETFEMSEREDGTMECVKGRRRVRREVAA